MLNPGLVTHYAIKLGRLDTAAMAAAGEYDDVLREPILVDGDDDGIGEPPRRETSTTIPAQISTESWERLRMAAGGKAPETEVVITVDYDELVQAGLVDATSGEAVFRTGDRLVEVQDMDAVVILQFPTDPTAADERPQLRVSEVRPTGFMGSQNLACLVLRSRDRAPSVGG